ncbi:MAG: phosphomannomutase/phosphoglucomutase [Oceanospirillaceae bacterium]|nr:phosphomannomutase/phosphoglucomutase [Oceanospirillaceae bacterium]
MSYKLDNLDHNIFRAYDIRGVVGSALTDATVYHLGRAFATQAKSQDVDYVCVAADGRISSPHLKQLLIEGLLDGGVNVGDVGFVATPVLYYAATHSESLTGIMITGSHNPKDYNGFKMMLAGNTLALDEIQQIKDIMLTEDYSEGEGDVEICDVRGAYMQSIISDIKLARPLKTVVDCGNGIPGEMNPGLIKALGCEVTPLYCEVDGNFPNHHPDPGKLENLLECISEVKKQGADIGLAFDGDGDRVGIVTPKGNMVYADRLMMLFAQDVLSRNPGAEIIYDVKCSRLLDKVITDAGGVGTMWKTGHSLIKRKMRESGALLAGEMSGHVFFKERWFGFDDGLYAAARLLEILAASDLDLDEIFAQFPEELSTPEINIQVSDDNKFDIIKQMQAGDYPGGNKNTIDGVRVDYPDGWGLIRASNTTPVLVLRFEASNQEALTRIEEQFSQQLHSVDPSLTIQY